MDLKTIVDFIKEKEITAYRIAQSTDLTEVGINKILNGESKKPRQSTIKTIAKFLHNNYGLYLSKEDESILDEADNLLENKNGVLFKEIGEGRFIMTVPLVPVKAYARYISECCDGIEIQGFTSFDFVVDKYARGNYVAFEIKGDSMNNGGLNDNPEGSIALCRELGRQHWMDGFRDAQYGWIIVHKDTILCKDIIDQDLESGILTCHSRNPSPEYPDFKIEINDIKQIFKIIKRTF